MDVHRYSQTAQLVAAMRAAHLLYDSQPFILEDTFAYPLLERKVKSRILRLLEHFRPLRLARGQALARARYAEDRTRQRISDGVRQCVLIGAGLDSFALRATALSPELRVFELDHPATQQWKLGRLRAAGLVPPSHLHFVPINFEEKLIGDALRESPYSEESPAVFSWLGTTYYLTRETIEKTLDSIHMCSAKGTELVLDFGAVDSVLNERDRAIKAQVMKRVESLGEPMLSFFHPDEFIELARDHGFAVAEHFAPEEQSRRYFAGRTDGIDVPGVCHLVSLSKV